MNKIDSARDGRSMPGRRQDAARNVGTGRLLLSWQPPTVVELKLAESTQRQQRVQVPENQTRN